MERKTLIGGLLAVLTLVAAQAQNGGDADASDAVEQRRLDIEAAEARELERRMRELELQEQRDVREREAAAERERAAEAAAELRLRAELREQQQRRLAQELEERERQLERVRREIQLDGRARDLDEARGEMERARREMELAARKIAELSTVQRVQYNDGVKSLRVFQQRSFIGATIDDDDEGARVVAVTPGGPAAEAGIESGDVITAINGTTVVGDDPSDAVIEQLGRIEPGATAIVTVQRDGEARTFNVETREGGPLGPYLSFFGDRNSPRVFVAPESNHYRLLTGFFGARWNDMELVELSEGLGSYFGTTEGLLVVRAPEDDSLGLRDGDVILEIGDRQPSSPAHAMRILSSFAPGETLALTIMRERRRQTLEYAIPEE